MALCGSVARLRGIASALAVMAALSAAPAAADLPTRAAEWAAADAATLRRAAPRLVESALAPTFDAADQRVGAYADWVYGWLSSLLTAWELGYLGITEAGREIYEGRLPDPGSLHAQLGGVVERRFEEIVVRPEQSGPSLTTGWERAMARLATLDARLAADRRARIERTAVALQDDPAPVLALHGGMLLAPSITDSPAPDGLTQWVTADVEQGAGGTAERVLTRSLRPLATRTISVTTRMLLAPAAGGLVASPVLGASGAGAAVMTLVAVSASVWGFDYAVNRMDSAINRPDFEAELRVILRDARARTSRIARRHADSIVCAAFTVAVATCPASAGVAAAGRPR